MTLDRATMDERPDGFTADDEAALRAFAKNADWVIDHPEAIAAYVGKFIVVTEQRIVAAGHSSVELRRAFRSCPDAYFRFVEPPRRPRMWRLGTPTPQV